MPGPGVGGCGTNGVAHLSCNPWSPQLGQISGEEQRNGAPRLSLEGRRKRSRRCVFTGFEIPSFLVRLRGGVGGRGREEDL